MSAKLKFMCKEEYRARVEGLADRMALETSMINDPVGKRGPMEILAAVLAGVARQSSWIGVEISLHRLRRFVGFLHEIMALCDEAGERAAADVLSAYRKALREYIKDAYGDNALE